MTVREAFERAFGPIPEGATCHIGYSPPMETYVLPVFAMGDKIFAKFPFWKSWGDVEGQLIAPDISNRLAESFRNFFGPEFDKILDEIPPETPGSNEAKI